MKKKSASTGNKHKVHGVDWLPLAFLGLMVVLWHVAVVVNRIPEFILPTPLRVFSALVEEWQLLLTHTGVTLAEALIGLSVSTVIGALFGLAMGYFDPVRRVLYPLFVVTQTVPMYVLAPLFILWFGFGILPKVIVVFLVCFFPITITFTQGLLKTDEGMNDLLTVMGASRWKIFCLLKIPQALPQFFSGLKIASAYSVVGAVISEWVGAQKGLGVFMTRAMKNFKAGALFADVLIIVVLSLLLYHFISFLEKRVCKHITVGGSF